MNVSPSQIKVYKGMKLEEVIPIHGIQMDEGNDLEDAEFPAPNVNFDSCMLSPTEKRDLLDLLGKYSDIFAQEGNPGQTQVMRHSIETTRPPIPTTSSKATNNFERYCQ